MLNQNDLDHLRWIAKRLVNRYREDPKILLIVDDIIDKIVGEITSYKNYNDFVSSSIEPCVKNLQEIINYTKNLPSITHNNTTQITIDKNTQTFENIDVSELLK